MTTKNLHTQPQKYPHITVRLFGQPSTAFPILAAVRSALREAGVSANEIAQFTAEATRGDRDHLLTIVHRWVTVQALPANPGLRSPLPLRARLESLVPPSP